MGIGKIFKKVAKAVKKVANVVKKAVDVVKQVAPQVVKLLDTAKNVFDTIKGAVQQQAPAEPLPAPNAQVLANAPANSNGSGVSLNGIAIPSKMPNASEFGDLTDPKNKANYDQAMLRFQEEQQAYNRAIDMLTKMMQMRHETAKGIIQNLRA